MLNQSYIDSSCIKHILIYLEVEVLPNFSLTQQGSSFGYHDLSDSARPAQEYLGDTTAHYDSHTTYEKEGPEFCHKCENGSHLFCDYLGLDRVAITTSYSRAEGAKADRSGGASLL